MSYPPSVSSLSSVSAAEPLTKQMIQNFGVPVDFVGESSMAAAASIVTTNPNSVIGQFLSDEAEAAEAAAAPTKLNRSSERVG